MREQDRDKDFRNWYMTKDFFMVVHMKEEYRPEYYCRSAWFARDEEMDKLQARIDELEKQLSKAEGLLRSAYGYTQDIGTFTTKSDIKEYFKSKGEKI